MDVYIKYLTGNINLSYLNSKKLCNMLLISAKKSFDLKDFFYII